MLSVHHVYGPTYRLPKLRIAHTTLNTFSPVFFFLGSGQQRRQRPTAAAMDLGGGCTVEKSHGGSPLRPAPLPRNTPPPSGLTSPPNHDLASVGSQPVPRLIAPSPCRLVPLSDDSLTSVASLPASRPCPVASCPASP
ncbi:hypothetical protein GUJ93_ZPchr0004g38922 [Zizania palustris]|uniref:Uncharacterized protein n=1 Tax=Zizania palustris TaxID=103762 RepID=A0A8J5V8K8_ZIZPA|nr:hypothetical protein GUJ93_ZPchr0004g38922 [Zizania palustris]